jgi:hypothetical protein
MSSFKKLSKSDVTVVPYYANKQWNISIDCFPTSSDYLTIYKGTNITGTFSSGSDPKSEGEYERLIYTQINQLFYQEYTASLNTSSLANSIYYESASIQRPTSSYFIYNDSDILVKNFPTGANETIRVVAINQNIYGNKIQPGNFVISSSAYYITDDAYGNLYDIKLAFGSYVSSSFIEPSFFVDVDPAWITHIGNVYYAHGLAVITNQDYQLMFPTASCIPVPTTTTTSTTSTTTTAAPTTTTTTSTSTTTTTVAPTTTTTSTTSTTTTAAPTTTTTTTTTTTAPTTTTSTTTSTTTVAPTTTTSTTTSTTTEETTLFIYARYINTNGNLQYSINENPNVNIGALPSGCSFITQLTGLTAGDTIDFSDVSGFAIAGAQGFGADCPTTGFGCIYPVTISSGANYVYITIDGSLAC